MIDPIHSVEFKKDLGRSQHGAPSSRDAFFEALLPIFHKDTGCILVSADDGGPAEKFARQLPRQFIQVGIAEQQAIGMAAGLAKEGKRPWVYAIAPFMSTRVHEFVKLDVCAMNLPVTILGVGAGYSYDIMGPSHHCVEDLALMRVLPNVEIYSPADALCARMLAQMSYESKRPVYIRFDRSALPDLYDEDSMPDLDIGMGTFNGFIDPEVAIVATGFAVHEARKAAAILGSKGIPVAVVDLFRLKPLNVEALEDALRGARNVVSLEEHFLAGGLGSILAETFSDANWDRRLLRLARSEEQGFVFDYGGRASVWRKTGLDPANAAQTITSWLTKVLD